MICFLITSLLLCAIIYLIKELRKAKKNDHRDPLTGRFKKAGKK
jgi:hypothetical protein